MLSITLSIAHAMAQQGNKIIGKYTINQYVDSRADLYLLPQQKYIIVFTGGAQNGYWNIQDSQVVLTALTLDNFVQIYGRNEPSIKDSVRIMFSNFTESNASVGISDGSQANLTPIYNPNPNCSSSSPVAKLPITTTNQFLVFTDETMYNGKLTDIYNNPQGYNDFVALYIGNANKPTKSYTFTIDNNTLKHRNDIPLERNALKEYEIEELVRLFDEGMKAYYINRIYGNPAYNIRVANFDKVQKQYKYVAQKNAYIDKDNYEEGSELAEEYDYHNFDFIYDYHLLAKSTQTIPKIHHLKTPLFIAECDNYESTALIDIDSSEYEYGSENKSKARILHDIAYEYYKAKNLDQAKKYILEAIAIDSTEADYYGMLIYIYALRGNYQQVHQLAIETIERFPWYELIYDVDGVSYYKEGNFLKCKHRMDQQFALEPVSERFYKNYLGMLDTLGLTAEVFPMYEVYLQLKNNNQLKEQESQYEGDIYEVVAKAYRKIKQPQKALLEINKALIINIENADYYIERSKIWVILGSISNKQIDLEKAYKLTDDIAKKETIKVMFKQH